MTFNTQVQRQVDKREAHQQQLHHMEVNMVYMAHITNSPVLVHTTIIITTQDVPPPLVVFTATEYVAPAANVTTAVT